VIAQLVELARRRADGGAMRCGVASSGRRSRSSGGGSSQPVSPKKQEQISGCNTAGGSESREPTATDAAPDELVGRALASAELGEELDLAFPAHAPFIAHHVLRPSGECLLDDVIAIGRSLLARLEREGCRVNVAIERETTATRVANTRCRRRVSRHGIRRERRRVGASPATTCSCLGCVRGSGSSIGRGAGALVASINARLDHALRVVAPPERCPPRRFTPAGLSALMLPVTQALSGKAVLARHFPLGTKLGEQVFDARVSLTDDPLRVGRTASRPLDDECVPSRDHVLVERGVVQRFIYDLRRGACQDREHGARDRGSSGSRCRHTPTSS